MWRSRLVRRVRRVPCVSWRSCSFSASPLFHGCLWFPPWVGCFLNPAMHCLRSWDFMIILLMFSFYIFFCPYCLNFLGLCFLLEHQRVDFWISMFLLGVLQSFLFFQILKLRRSKLIQRLSMFISLWLRTRFFIY